MDKKILLQHISDSLAERGGISKRKADNFLRSFFDIIETGLSADGIVKVKGFGTTKIVAVNNRESVNIITGERFQIEGHDKVSFTPDPMFRDLVNRPFAHFSTVILDEAFNEADLDTIHDDEDIENDELATAPDNLVASADDEISVTTEFTMLSDETSIAPIDTTEAETQQSTDEMANSNTPEENGDCPEFAEDTVSAEHSISTVDTDSAEDTDSVEETTSVITEEDYVIPSELYKETAMSDNESQSHTEDNMQSPIIINNTIPESHTNRWRIAFGILASLVLMTLSYFAGYFRIFCPCNESPAAVTMVEDRVASAKSVAAKPDTITQKSSTDTAKAAPTDTAAKIASAEPNPQALAKDYKQMDGADYLITGVLESHEMKAGDNLYKLAKQAYGNKELASYIIFHNGIENPDLVQLGQKIEIPRLHKK